MKNGSDGFLRCIAGRLSKAGNNNSFDHRGSRIRFHGEKPALTAPHVFVSNHTSFIDFLVLSSHSFPHAIIAQKHGGIIGYFEDFVLSLNGSLVFDRKQKDDRSFLAYK